MAWFLQKLDGWDSAEVRSESQLREAEHGAWASPVYLGERPITLSGTMLAPDLATLDAAADRLRALPLMGAVLTVMETVPKRAVVRRSGRTLIDYQTDTAATYSVLVTAADPRLYATTETVTTLRLPTVAGGLTLAVTFPITIDATVVAGDTVVVNAGSIDALPQIRISGPVSQPLVSVTGPDGTATSLLYGGDIEAGDWVDLDCDAHTAYYNGTASRRSLISGAWPALQPGASNLAFRAGSYSATAALTVTYRSAWM
ncbi:phage tail family protein [Streptomyces sp. OR43]|uniref:phage tail family protein n=1 Tax=Streptomyces sp. or43 TaxID=2478957 RepID=UPI0021CA353D|nr:phage tail family protein [Streptomyces sp. or43]